jgi:hypothetical protein
VRVTPLAAATLDGAGWYADPSGGLDRFRWWDGTGWTRWLSRDPTAGPPPVTPEPAPAPAQEIETSDIDALGTRVVAGPDAEPEAATDQTVKLPVAVAITLATVVLALIAVGAVVALSADRPLTGPAVAPPAAAKALVVVYDARTRVAAIQELKVTTPATPFSCTSSEEAQPPTFTSLVACDVTVHENYNAQGSDWTSMTGLGPLSSAMVSGDDLDATADRAFDGVIGEFYPTDRPTITKRAHESVTGISPKGKAVLVSARANVKIKGLPTHYDKVVLVVFQLQSGSYAAWLGIAPNDLASATRAVLQTSLNTLSAL